MRKLLKLLTIAALFCGLILTASPVMAAYVNYTIDVYRDTGYRTTAGGYGTAIATGITYQVLTADADTESTIYSDAGTTSMTNPVTTTVFDVAGEINFYISGTTATVLDIIVVDTAGGYTIFLEDVTTATTHCVIDERANVLHHGMIWFVSTASSTEVDTGIEFDRDTAVHNVIIEVVTIDSTICIDVGIDSSGTNGDSDGFIDGALLATAGFKNPKSAVGPIGGTGQAWLSSAAEQFSIETASWFLGALLGTAIQGTETSASIGQGMVFYWDHVVDATDEQSLIYVYSETEPDTAVGYIHYFFTRIR